jgi:uncharacterized membrane protein YeiH
VPGGSLPVLDSFDPTLLLVLNLVGTFVFGLSGGPAGVQARLDAFGVVVLAVVAGLAGGITRDLLIGIPPQTFRDWRYLAVAGVGGGVLRDILVREIPVVLRTGLYTIPALVGAGIVVAAAESGTHDLAFPIVGAAACFLIRLAGVLFDLNVPQAPRRR